MPTFGSPTDEIPFVALVRARLSRRSGAHLSIIMFEVGLGASLCPPSAPPPTKFHSSRFHCSHCDTHVFVLWWGSMALSLCVSVGEELQVVVCPVLAVCGSSMSAYNIDNRF